LINAVASLTPKRPVSSIDQSEHTIVSVRLDEDQVRTEPFQAFLRWSLYRAPPAGFVDPATKLGIADPDPFQEWISGNAADHGTCPLFLPSVGSGRDPLIV